MSLHEPGSMQDFFRSGGRSVGSWVAERVQVGLAMLAVRVVQVVQVLLLAGEGCCWLEADSWLNWFFAVVGWYWLVVIGSGLLVGASRGCIYLSWSTLSARLFHEIEEEEWCYS